jgi:hypothetical protein
MTMMKSTISLLALSAFSAGFALVLSRLTRGREQPSDGELELTDDEYDAIPNSNVVSAADTLAPSPLDFVDGVDVDLSDAEELPLDLVPDTVSFEDDEPYDALSTDDLASEWLARATQTGSSPRTQDTEYLDIAPDQALADETDFSGRPTDPMIDVNGLPRSELDSPLSARVPRRSGDLRPGSTSLDGWELPEDGRSNR